MQHARLPCSALTLSSVGLANEVCVEKNLGRDPWMPRPWLDHQLLAPSPRPEQLFSISSQTSSIFIW